MTKLKDSNTPLDWAGIRHKMVRAGRKLTVESQFMQTMNSKMNSKKWSVLLVIMGFLLGRAMILEQLTPFALSYFAVIFYLRKDLVHWVGVAIGFGSLLSIHEHTSAIIVGMLVFLLIQKGMQKYDHTELSYAPFIVFSTSFLVRLFMVLVASELSWYMLMLICVEAILSFILTLVFIQALPIFTISRKNHSLKHEEIICLIIMIASVMTGTVGWTVADLSIEHMLSRYLILLFAYVGGAPLGTTVGVVAGLILSLANTTAISQMSLLAFSGMLAGLLREGNKIAVSLGMLLGTAILSLYIGEPGVFMPSLWESLVAVVFFMLTPLRATRAIASYVPGTQESMSGQHDYAKRIRTLLGDRIQQFSEVFHQLAHSFTQSSASKSEASDLASDRFINNIADRMCATCWRQNTCWDKQYQSTLAYMTNMMNTIHTEPDFAPNDIPLEWKQACVKSEQMLSAMKGQFEAYRKDLHWRKQIKESKRLVSDQLLGVSQVMDDLAKEIKREGQALHTQEEQIREALEDLGLSIHSIDIYSLDEGNVEIEMIHQFNKGYDECRKIIAPLLSSILGEHIAVQAQDVVKEGGYSTVTFASAQQFVIHTGSAGTAKGGELLSGDSISTMELGNGKFAVALSDGMGNGERAHTESRTALTMLHYFLQSGMDERLAIKSVNSVLLLRSSDEMFATIDVALIDLYNAQTTFVKIGSTPSFIKRGRDVIPVTANNLPAGIIQDIEVDLITTQLLAGDILIMMSDGVYDAPGHKLNKELWMKRMIQEIDAYEPQHIADLLLEKVIRYDGGEIHDDMTIVVARIDRVKPEWTTFRYAKKKRIDRPKVVS